MAGSCYEYPIKLFSSIVNAPGGMTTIGVNPGSTQGRRTPMYGPDFLANKLDSSIGRLVDYGQQVTMMQGYRSVLQHIQDSASDVISFTAAAFDSQLQVEATQQTTSLESSKTIGDLYYGQFQYNFNVTTELAVQVQDGPPPQGGKTFAELQKKCKEELIFKAVLQLATATVALCTGFGEAFAVEAAVETEEAVEAGEAVEKVAKETKETTDGEKSGKSALDLANTGKDLFDTSKNMLDAISGVYDSFTWDPDLQLPPLPPSPNGTNYLDREYADASSAWYLAAQKNLSAALIHLSPAFWESFYLEAENNFSPFLNDPPSCGAATDMSKSIHVYLNTVKNFKTT